MLDSLTPERAKALEQLIADLPYPADGEYGCCVYCGFGVGGADIMPEVVSPGTRTVAHMDEDCPYVLLKRAVFGLDGFAPVYRDAAVKRAKAKEEAEKQTKVDAQAEREANCPGHAYMPHKYGPPTCVGCDKVKPEWNITPEVAEGLHAASLKVVRCGFWNWDHDPPAKCVPWPHPSATRDDCPWCKLVAAMGGDNVTSEQMGTYVREMQKLPKLQEAEFGPLQR